MNWNYNEAFARNDGLISQKEQQELRSKRVAIVGMGGVGGVHAVTLARLGVGSFNLADYDCFEVANFNRQYGARIDDIGRPKIDVMAQELKAINPESDLRLFENGVDSKNPGSFLEGVDLLVDGVDFFALEVRRSLFAEARRRGIYAVTAAPLGFGSAWLVFSPTGMSFDEYFDLNDTQSKHDQLARFLIGLAPSALHRTYMDFTKVDIKNQRGPSAGLACQICAGVVSAESLKILLNRDALKPAPYYNQFDAYRGKLVHGKLARGNRGLLQRIKRSRVSKLLSNVCPPISIEKPLEGGVR